MCGSTADEWCDHGKIRCPCYARFLLIVCFSPLCYKRLGIVQTFLKSNILIMHLYLTKEKSVARLFWSIFDSKTVSWQPLCMYFCSKYKNGFNKVTSDIQSFSTCAGDATAYIASYSRKCDVIHVVSLENLWMAVKHTFLTHSFRNALITQP